MSKRLVGKNRKSTRYRVEYPTLPSFNIQPEFIELKQGQGQHDIMTIKYASNRGDYFTNLKTGVPVKVTWSQGSRSRTWYGYVSVTNQNKANQSDRQTKVYCVGSSFLLKNSSPRVFKDKTVPEVAQIIAREYGFSFAGENHPSRFEQITISGDTYWEWLQESAYKIGYGCYIDEMSLVFRPINKLIKQNKTNLPVMQFWTLPVPNKKFGLDRTLDSIELKSGEYVEDGNATRSKKQVGGVNPISGKSFLANKSPDKAGDKLRGESNGVLFSEHQTDSVANSASWAKISSEASASLAKFNMPAHLIGQGDPRVMPYSMVYVDGTGKHTDGVWLVKNVVHKLNRGGEYSMEIDVLSDGLGASSVDYANGLRGASYPTERSIVGKIDFEQYLSSTTFSTSRQEGTVTVKLPSKGRTTSSTAVLKNKVDINKLIKNKTTTAKPGLANSPHVWKSKTPGNTVRIRKVK